MDISRQMEALGRTTGATAHDFNNLLTIILGYASLMLRTLPPDDPSRSAFAEIHQAAERGRALTGELATRYKAALAADEG